jgi:hypothetical protein
VHVHRAGAGRGLPAGFRAELCWDHTGATGDDLDLWLHRPANTTNWPSDATSPATTCYYYNCRNTNPPPAWGYSNSTGGGCREPASGGVCHNPRLDVDNIDQPGIPENINVDTPHDADRFRVSVNYYGGSGVVHPMVNLYCGGQLRATYGGADAGGMHFGSAPLTAFNTPGSDSTGSLWRVADVVMQEPADTCTLHPIHPTGTTSGYCVRNDHDRTYSDNCAAP